ncbi:hypothetical protein [Sphingomonas immobilis]|uniref:Uncharacterized protein n=1 Tax=Sphingomonas immobilis TaxID=3063997 RepID=A0ABT8ZX30_9SPHN|nr:hypothetical protein [Sphingomonas sp. CA1-15]MDO7841833.1 hypothetical protein [Sphingomonas sp. CA1-15]
MGTARNTVGTVRDRAVNAVGTLRDRAGNVVSTAKDRATGLTSGSGSADGIASGNANGGIDGAAFSGSGEGAGSGSGGPRGMKVRDTAGNVIGRVRSAATDARERIETISMKVGDKLATLPAASFSSNGGVLVSAMGQGEVQKTAQ